MLARAKAAAVERFDAETDADAYKRFGAIEPLYTPVASAPVVAPQAPAAAVEPVKADK